MSLISFLTENNSLLLTPLIIFLLFFTSAFICSRWLGPFVAAIAERFHHYCTAKALKAFLKPSSYSLISLGAVASVASLPDKIKLHLPWLNATGKVAGISCVVFFTVGLIRAIHVVPEVILGVGSRLSLDTGKALAKFVTSILQAFVILIAVAIILDILGYNINGVLTGLGLGGLSFALAGQDIVSNLFGGIIISTERPFEIGDWVKTVDVEGTVEDIGLRCTKIRTLDDALTIVPNQKFTSTAITNWSRLNRRLVCFTLGLEYQTTPQVMQNIVDDLKKMLTLHTDIDNETIQVRFMEFNASSMDIYIQCYAHITNLMDFRALREELNFSILKIMQDHGASMAFPSRTIYISGSEKNVPCL